jgi:hypothetical protein
MGSARPCLSRHSPGSFPPAAAKPAGNGLPARAAGHPRGALQKCVALVGRTLQRRLEQVFDLFPSVGVHQCPLLSDTRSLAYSALASLRIGMSGSASFQRSRKAW